MRDLGSVCVAPILTASMYMTRMLYHGCSYLFSECDEDTVVAMAIQACVSFIDDDDDDDDDDEDKYATDQKKTQ